MASHPTKYCGGGLKLDVEEVGCESPTEVRDAVGMPAVCREVGAECGSVYRQHAIDGWELLNGHPMMNQYG